LADLLTADTVTTRAFAALDLTDVTADSRSVKPGDLFRGVGGQQR